MKSYYYQVRNILGKKIIGGVIHAETMDAAHDKAMKREGITIKTEYYDDGSLYEGLVWRRTMVRETRPVYLLVGKV